MLFIHALKNCSKLGVFNHSIIPINYSNGIHIDNGKLHRGGIVTDRFFNLFEGSYLNVKYAEGLPCGLMLAGISRYYVYFSILIALLLTCPR